MSVDKERSAATSQFDFELIYPRPGCKVVLDKEPTGRSGHSMVSDNANLYILGGYNPLGRVLNQGRPTVLEELWKFNLATKKWTKLETEGFPSTCASSCMIMRGNNMYVFGGTGYPFGQVVSNTFKVLDIGIVRDISGHQTGGASCNSKTTKAERANTWYNLLDGISQQGNTPQDDEDKPPKGYGQSIIFHDEFIYTFGGAVGFYNEAIADMHRLSLLTLTWEKLTPFGEIPDGRYKQEIIKDQNCFYLVGGGRLHDAQPVHTLYSYSFAQNAWTKHELPPDPAFGFPKPRSAFSLVQLHQDVYICGGQCYGASDGLPEILNDIWHLSLDKMQWKKLPVTLPERIYFHRAVVSVSKHLYVYGGVLESGKRSNKMYRYRLPFQVAELSELCWFLITRLWKDLHRANLQEMRVKYGIPERFIDRIQ